MITAVLDANVLASGFLRYNPDAIPTQIVNAWRRRAFMLFISEHLRLEVIHTLRDPYFRRNMSPVQASLAASLLLYQATQVSITEQVQGIATHPEDDLVLATAVSGAVQYLVTGDKKLQGKRTYQGVRIVSPLEFLEILISQAEEERESK